MEYFSATDLLEGLRAAGGVPAHTEVPQGKGRAEWVGAQLRYRLTIKQLIDGTTRWWLAVGDRHLGRSFQEGGILALVSVVDAPEVDPLPWPATEADVVPFLRALYARLVPAAAFVADRRDLCALLISPGDVRRGDLVADLRAGYVERVLRAFCVARAAGDVDAAAVALAILQAPPASGPVDGPSSLLDQARIWADQWSYQSGVRIEVPDSLEAVGLVPPAPPVPGSTEPTVRPRPDELPSFWERVG